MRSIVLYFIASVITVDAIQHKLPEKEREVSPTSHQASLQEEFSSKFRKRYSTEESSSLKSYQDWSGDLVYPAFAQGGRYSGIKETKSGITSIRPKRSLGGSVSYTLPVYESPGWKNKALRFQPRFKNDKSPKNDVITYSYQLSEKSAFLNGSVVMRWDSDGSSLLLLINYRVKGNADGSVKLTPAQFVESRLSDVSQRWKIQEIPDHCHLKKNQTTAKYVKEPQSCNGAVGKNSTPDNARQTSSSTSRKIQSAFAKSQFLRTESFSPEPPLQGRKNGKRQIRKNCRVKVVTYQNSYLCIKPTASPCLLISFTGSAYRMNQKVCPDRLPLVTIN
ncbi:unnamed protein product [Clavelina lepadiformis]|uniref:Uncharacterized protein n=1 Tax=Clavelina lepadiformis TaxID=159417 RepID=A0ABP0EWC9_CLALP